MIVDVALDCDNPMGPGTVAVTALLFVTLNVLADCLSRVTDPVQCG